LGCAEPPKHSGVSFIASFFLVACVYLHSHSRGQAQRDGVLELDLQDVEQLRRPKGATATLRAECKHDKSVTSAYWDPRGRSIVSTCYDDALRSMFGFFFLHLRCVPHSYARVW